MSGEAPTPEATAVAAMAAVDEVAAPVVVADAAAVAAAALSDDPLTAYAAIDADASSAPPPVMASADVTLSNPVSVSVSVSVSDAPVPPLSTGGDRVAFWRDIEVFYKEGLFCDLALVCSAGNTLYCHKMVLAALSKVRSRAKMPCLPFKT